MEMITAKLANGNRITYKIVDGTAYHAETPDDVVKVLEWSRKHNQRIRVFYGDTETGRDWMDEHDTIGTVGRSTGNVKIPLMIKNSRSTGGGALLDHCIMRITVDKHEVYRHPKYNQPELEVREYTTPGKYPFGVIAHENELARFEKREQAERWVKFVKGERNSK